MNVESRLNKRFPKMRTLIPTLVALVGLTVAEYPERTKDFQTEDGSRVIDNPSESIMQVYNSKDSTLKGIFSYNKRDTLVYVDSAGNQYTITGDSLPAPLEAKREQFVQYKNERGWFD